MFVRRKLKLGFFFIILLLLLLLIHKWKIKENCLIHCIPFMTNQQFSMKIYCLFCNSGNFQRRYISEEVQSGIKGKEDFKILKKLVDKHVLIKPELKFDKKEAIDGNLKRFVNDTWIVAESSKKRIITTTTKNPTTTTTEKSTTKIPTTTTIEKSTTLTTEKQTTSTSEKPMITTKKQPTKITIEKPSTTTTTMKEPETTTTRPSTTTTEKLLITSSTTVHRTTQAIPLTSSSKTLVQDTRQKCRIPKLDPFHREAQPYIRYNWLKETCQIKQEKSRIEDGKLVVDVANVLYIRLSYILRVADDVTKLDSKIVYNRSRTKNMSTGNLFKHLLKHDFIKVDIKYENGGKEHSEYHMYPVKEPPGQGAVPFKKLIEAGDDKYNVLLIMLDSVSHACAQRYLKKTYQFLEENPYTTIMKGHTIVGDATTPQLSALFFGAQPAKLHPEGRRGFTNSQQIDDWPSIFKEYKQKGYVTLHSEDEPGIGAFNFRLRGFAKQPTFKYLRAWWRRTDDLSIIKSPRSFSCPITFTLEYLHNFNKEYSHELSFTVLVNSALTHNEPERVQMFDNGFIELFENLNKTKRLESTVVVFFGDHGMREGGFRQTTQGKLEERLPFMTITLPPKFYRNYPMKVQNLKENSFGLTTPYDIHVTLKHLLSLRSDPPQHPFGKSVFTNITNLNRGCSDAGIDPFWCVCRRFQNIPDYSTNNIVSSVADSMVDSINQILTNISIAEKNCQTLRLKSILKASKMILKENNKNAVFDTYELMFETDPCGGRFETTGEYNRKTKSIKIGTNISRVNRYGNQPRCIEKQFPHLRKFCCCKN